MVKKTKKTTTRMEKTKRSKTAFAEALSCCWEFFFSLLSGLLLLWSPEQRIILKISRLMKEQYGDFVIEIKKKNRWIKKRRETER